MSAALGWLLAATGCATSQHAPPSAEVLKQADRDFARYAAEQGVAAAFVAYAAPDATMLPMGELPAHGPDAIRRLMADTPGELRWEPVAAEISRSGDLGYTWGTYQFQLKDAQGQPTVRHGKYATVWRKQPDGAWKFVVDIGNPSPAPKP